MEKSLNQQWKESGTTLSYREWRRREDEKMASFDGIPSVIPSPKLSDSASYKRTIDEMQRLGGYKEDISNKTVFGINKTIFVVFGLIIVGAIGYKIYQKNKK